MFWGCPFVCVCVHEYVQVWVEGFSDWLAVDF